MEESAFASIRVRRYGNLCVTFTPDLKILAYDFNVITIDHSFPRASVCSEMRALEQVIDHPRTLSCKSIVADTCTEDTHTAGIGFLL